MVHTANHSLPNDEAVVAAIATFLVYPIPIHSRRTCSTACIAWKATTQGCSMRRPVSPARAATCCSPGTDYDPAGVEAWRPVLRDPSSASGIVRRWPQRRFRAGDGARPLTFDRLMPGLLKAWARRPRRSGRC